MIYRKLGRTAVDVGVIGLGAEHLEHAPRETLISVIDEAMDKGLNYIDLLQATPDVRDNLGIALQNRRHKVMIAGHLGSILEDGQYAKSRDNTLAENYINDFLLRLKTDCIDVLMLHSVDEKDDYDNIFGPGGLLELALRLQKEGKTRFIGMSSHRTSTALQAVNSGKIDVLMFPVNPVTDTLPTDAATFDFLEHKIYNQSEIAKQGKFSGPVELYHACAGQGVAGVAMKPYAAGVIFRDNPSSIVLTPVQCISYALSQPGISAVVPGCRNLAEMKAALAFLEATEEQKDYSRINLNSAWKLQGVCMYCNHCLPCPVSIDIGAITRLKDTAEYERTELITAEYEVQSAKASDCIECGLCTERCPFGVDVIANMTRAAEIFSK
ncbi:aldo/keto reductase [Chloroflexota bacterium]